LQNWKWCRRRRVVGNGLVIDVMEDVHVDFLVERGSSRGWKLMENGLCSSWNVVARGVGRLEQCLNTVNGVAKFRRSYVVRG